MKATIRWPILLVLVAALINASLLTGCSSAGGQGLAILPTGHFLLKSTKQVMRSAPSGAPLPRELQKSVLPAYYLQPGDVLLVEPLSLDSQLRFPSDQTILADGTIDLGRYGRPVVAGKTVDQVEVDVAALVAAVDHRNEPVNVRLVNPQSAVYYVLGEVAAPGSFPLVGRETVLDGIIAAGGLTSRASPCGILLSRPTPPGSCRVVLPVCYRHIVQLGDTATNYQLLPGDRIYVSTRTFCEQLCRRTNDCPYCQGLQCPCPSAITPVQPEFIPLPPVTPEEVPPTPPQSVKFE